MPARSFSPSGGGKIGGGSVVPEIGEHAPNPKHIQSIIVLRIVGSITIRTGTQVQGLVNLTHNSKVRLRSRSLKHRRENHPPPGNCVLPSAGGLVPSVPRPELGWCEV
jgi:hypothetical protein